MSQGSVPAAQPPDRPASTGSGKKAKASSQEADALRPATWPLLIPAMFLVVVTVISFLFVALDRFEGHLIPEIQRKTGIISQAAALRVERAFVLGATLDNLRGADDAFRAVINANPEIVAITLTDPHGVPVTTVHARTAGDEAPPDDTEATASLQTHSEPIVIRGAVATTLVVTVDPNYARKVLTSLLWDIVGVLLVVLTAAFGLLTFIIQGGLGNRMQGFHDLVGRLGAGSGQRFQPPLPGLRDTSQLLPRLLALRVVIFVFFLGEEMTRPFLPDFIRGMALQDTILALNGRMAAGVALSLFILTLSVVQLLGGRWSERIGRMPTLLLGVGLASAGMIATAVSDTLLQVLLSRALTAVGYGLVFIAAQGVAIDLTSRENRAAGLSMFVGGVMAAILVGPSIGGMTADHLGPTAALVIAAIVTALSAILAIALLPRTQPVRLSQKRSLRADLKLVLSNRRMIALVVLTAIPAKIVLNAVVFYLVPLTLSEQGETLAAIGRVVMVYGLCMVVLGGAAARVGDRSRENLSLLVVAGAIISGLGVIVGGWLGVDFWTATIAVAALGLGQALSVAPQLALVPEICHRESEIAGTGTVFGIFRLLERLGGAAGPLLAGWLAATSPDMAFTVIGLTVAISGLGYLILELLFRPIPTPDTR